MQLTVSSRIGAFACTVSTATISGAVVEIRFAASGSINGPSPRLSPRKYCIGKVRFTKGGAKKIRSFPTPEHKNVATSPEHV